MAKTTVTLKLTASIVVQGEILKRGQLVEVSESEAQSLLHRGKAELATAADEPEAEGDAQNDDLRTDGPTVAEFVTAGYQASNYPPEGYASRSTDEEIAEAVKAQAEAADPATAAKTTGKKK